MITTCTGCQTRYRLDVEKVPRRVVRVRCPGCGTVFELDGTALEQPEAVAQPAAKLVDSTPAPEPPVIETPPLEPVAETTPPPAPQAAPETPPAAEPVAKITAKKKPAAAKPSSPQVGTAVAVDDSPAAPTKRRTRDKARMLARALVSDILVYNRDQRDKALETGNLVEALGTEIKKSWKLYKEKVGEETANGTTHFRDALNEILADGERIF